MYQIRTPNVSKNNHFKRWMLPDRVFFACGGCHILAHAFLDRYKGSKWDLFWIKPTAGYIGNHIFVGRDAKIFDYHGYSSRTQFLNHTWKRARQKWPGWDAAVIPISPDVLLSEAKSREIEGLWLREPAQFFRDPLPRAHLYLDRFPNPCRVGKVGAGL